MLDNKTMLPQEIYLRYLQTVGGIKFTLKETEVISCIYNKRGISKIASLLDIASKTVGVHIANIKNKIGCSTKEDIIDFIERSGQHSLINNHHQSIKVRHCFEQHLKKIRLTAPAFTCEIISWLEEGSQSTFSTVFTKHLRELLEGHLKSVKIQTTSITKKANQFIFSDKDLDNTIRIHVLPRTWEKQLQDQEKLLIYPLSQDDDPDNGILLLLERGPIVTETKGELFDKDLTGQNYYFVVVEILKRLFPSLSLDTIISEFKNQSEMLNNSLEILHLYLGRNELIVENKENNNFDQNDGHSKVHYVRADLLLPTEATLLHRPNLLAEMEQKLTAQKDIQSIALIGIGGAGKTTLAHQYARSQKSPVIWGVNVETQENLIYSFEKFAYTFSRTEEEKKILRGLQEINASSERMDKILLFVREKLKAYSDWVLIYDNVEKFSDIQKYFPSDPQVWGKGKVIITTRDNNIKNNPHIGNAIQIGELGELEKLSFFTKIMNNESKTELNGSDTEVLKKFLSDIPPFPLDIAVAIERHSTLPV